MAGSYIPCKDAEFDVWFKNTGDYAALKMAGSPPAWTHIPQAELDKYNAAHALWHAAYTATLTPHSKVETLAKDEARAGAVIRPFVKLYLKEEQPAVTDMDRAAMNIPNKDATPTAHPVPVIKPLAEAVPSGKGKHTVTAINPATGDRKKPEMVTGAAFAHRKRRAEEPKSRAEDMPSEYEASPVREFQWEEADYNMAVDYAAVYENGHGTRGPWPDVVTLVIT
jgi:hypothetical protein